MAPERKFTEPKNLLGVLVEVAISKFNSTTTATTDEGETYPYNLKHASYEALLGVGGMGIKPKAIFPTLVSQSRTQAFVLPIAQIPEGLDIETIMCIDIISETIRKAHPELEAEDRIRMSGGNLSIHD